MAKITREPQLIFGGSLVANNNIAKFGSLKIGTPAYSLDPSDIQTTEYLNGWAAAVVNNNAPALQDMNGLFYLTTYQLAYLMQAGIAEWNAATTYYIGSLVNDTYGNVFKSLIDTNTSALTVKASWRIAVQGQAWTSNVTYHTGDVVASTDGKTQYACLADSTTAALTDSTKWRPVSQNGTVAATGPTTTLNCQDGCVFDAAAGAGGNKTFTITKMHDGQTVNVNVYGAAANTIAWTLSGAKAEDAGALTAKTGITYSNTMTSGQSLYTLTRIGSIVVINSLHGIA